VSQRRTRAALARALARRGEPVFVSGTRALPAASLLVAARAPRATTSGPTDGDPLAHLVALVADLWHDDVAGAARMSALVPGATGACSGPALVDALGRREGRVRLEALDLDAVQSLAPADALAELLAGAALVRLGGAFEGFATF
jgi:hypothetical protein